LDEELEPDWPLLLSLMSEGATAIIIPRYFGFASRAIGAIKEACEKRDILVVEDLVGVADSLLSGRVAILGDFAFNSLRKFLAVPDGSEIAGPLDWDLVPDRPEEPTAAMRLDAMRQLAEARAAPPGSHDEDVAVRRVLALEKRLVTDSFPRRASRLSGGVLGATDLDQIARTRMWNFSWLRDRFGPTGLSGGRVLPFRPHEPVPSSPLFFPVLVQGDRNAFRSRLAAERVYCPVHWPLNASSSAALSPGARRICESILSIPIDQRLEAQDLARAADLIERLVSP